MTSPVFVVSSGRSGTFSLYTALAGLPGVEARHEPWCEQIQKMGTLWHSLGYRPSIFYEYKLRDFYLAAVHHSQQQFWISIGNKESFLMGPLKRLFPNGRFIWLVRDGRKTCLSYFHKLSSESYDDDSVKALIDCMDSSEHDPIPPPPEKKFWWPVPRTRSERSEFLRWDRWRRICWYFNEVCNEIRSQLDGTQYMFKLERLVAETDEVARLLDAAGLDIGHAESVQLALQHPTNVHEPINHQMTPEQEAVYREMCGEVHEWLGYGWGPLEEVKYDDQ